MSAKALLMRRQDIEQFYSVDSRQSAEIVSELRPVGTFGKESLYAAAEIHRVVKAGAGK